MVGCALTREGKGKKEKGKPDVKCRYCGTEIAAKALICYKCGNATTEPRIKPPDEGPILGRPRRRRLPYVAIAIIVVLALLAAWLLGLQV